MLGRQKGQSLSMHIAARAVVASIALASLVGSGALLAQRAGGAAGDAAASQTPASLTAVRQALGHGDVAAARRAAQTADGPAERDLALAVVEIFEGQWDQAAARLAPMADRSPLGEPALELGLLDLERGRREEARRRLDRLAANRSLQTPDDYLRLARAAIGVREFLLANDAFVRVGKEARADIQTLWGDMFRTRFKNGDAATSYRDALVADPNWVPAHIGLARAFADEDPDEAKASFEAARTIAPNHPDVLLLAAERALESDDLAAATSTLDRLAAVRPGSVDEAALRVAVAYEEGGPGALEPALGLVRAANPRSAKGYRAAADRAAHAYRFAEAVDLARLAVGVDPDDPYAQFDLGLYQMRTGQESDARQALERSWALDNSSPFTKNLLDLLDKLDTFVTINAPNMIFKFDRAEAAVMQVYAPPLALEAFQTFEKRYGFTPKGPILIEVFPVHDDFAVRTLGLPGLVGALGACFGQVVTMDSPRANTPAPFSWQATLWHEIAHVFSLQLSNYKVPRWLTEGISAYEEHRRVPAWGRELTLEYGRALATKQNFGVKGLPDAFKRPESLAMAYFEASLVVEHLVEANGDEGLRKLLRAYGEGATDASAFTTAFGRSVDEVDASFAKFVDTRYGALRAAMAPPPSQAAPDDVTALRARAAAAPGNFVSQVTLGQALVRAGDLDGAKGPLERAAALAPQASGDGSPRALLAFVAEQQADPARARREYRALLEADHANIAAARRLLAVAGENVTDEEYALRFIADLDPFDADVHGRLGRRLFVQSKFEPALQEFQAALAMGPANRAEAHADVAETLLKLGRRDDARKAALDSLKEAPTYARAQDLLLEAMGRSL